MEHPLVIALLAHYRTMLPPCLDCEESVSALRTSTLVNPFGALALVQAWGAPQRYLGEPIALYRVTE